MKKCSFCGIEKNESEFFKKRANSLEGFCKQCKKEKLKKRKAEDPEKFKEIERVRSEKRRHTKEWKEWRKDHQLRNRKEISEKARIYYTTNENVRKKSKEWKSKNREKLNNYLKEHVNKNPLKVRARKIVNYHIQKGNMTRPIKCSKCIKECKPEAHHEDYMKPLDIIWLCRSCHGKEHRKHKESYDCDSSSGHNIHLHRKEGEKVNSLS
jgi:hypothetical protein